MIVDESDPRFYVAPSTIPRAGEGLFARADLPVGARLAVPGMLVRRGSASDRYTAFADEYKFRVGDYLLIPGGIGAMANHSAQPNLRKVVEGEALFLELTREVPAGEELCFAYSDDARERYGIR